MYTINYFYFLTLRYYLYFFRRQIRLKKTTTVRIEMMYPFTELNIYSCFSVILVEHSFQFVSLHIGSTQMIELTHLRRAALATVSLNAITCLMSNIGNGLNTMDNIGINRI